MTAEQKMDLMRSIIEEYLEYGQANEDRANTVILVLDTIIRYEPDENTKKMTASREGAKLPGVVQEAFNLSTPSFYQKRGDLSNEK